MKNANFIAIDFETATTVRYACQLGLTVVKQGEIVESKCFLIQPPKNRYTQRLIEIHHITPEMTVDAPTFDVLWEEIKEYFECNFIIAHNFSFDMDVLYKNLDYYNIPYPIIMGYCCTYQLTNLSLEQACKAYNVPLSNHHDGKCDAEACANIFLQYLRGVQPLEFEKTNNKNENTYSGYRDKTNNTYTAEPQYPDPFNSITDDVLSKLPISPIFQDKKFIITGITIFDRNKAYNIITALGGRKYSYVNEKLDYLILGEDPGYKKIEQAKELQEDGCKIRVISQLDFINLVVEALK